MSSHMSWNDLAEQVLAGRELTHAQSLTVLQSPEDELLELLAATFRVRRRHFGHKVHLYFLKNAKSGL